MSHVINGNVSRHPQSVVDYCKENFVYNRFTGFVFNKKTGKRLGWVQTIAYQPNGRPLNFPHSRRLIHTQFGKIREHHIIMMLELGYCPMVIDHRDHDATNNKWNNLVFVGADGSPMNTSRNAAQTRRASTRLPRFVIDKTKSHKSKPYQVLISHIEGARTRSGGRACNKSVGYFATIEEAITARNDWLLTNRDITSLPDDILRSIEETTGRQLLAA